MSSNSSPLWNVVQQMLEDHQHGELMAVDHYCAKAPQHEHAIRLEYGKFQSASGTEGDNPPGCASMEDSRIGQSINHYQLLRLIGRGAQGSVYLARDTRHDRDVALKLLPRWASTSPSSRWQRLQREAAALAKLSHPAISRLLDSGEIDGSPYLVTEYIDGSTFSRLQPPSNNAQLRVMLRLFQQCALALHSAHLAGIVHRDVKPGNLMLGAHGQPVILDFGLAFDDEASDDSNMDRLTRTGTTLGTPAYLAPELLHQDEPTARSDQYSLAATLYHCLTGKSPRKGERIAEILHSIEHDTPQSPCRLNASLPLEMEIVLEKAMSQDPAHRYPDLRAFANDLDAICRRSPIVARRLPMNMRVRRWVQRHPVGTTVVGFLALFLLAGFWQTTKLLEEKNSRLLQAEREKYLMASRLLVDRNPMGATRLAKFALDNGVDASARTALLSALVGLHGTFTGEGLSGNIGPKAFLDRKTSRILYVNYLAELCLDLNPSSMVHDIQRFKLPPLEWSGRGDDELGGRLALDDQARWAAAAPIEGAIRLVDLKTGKWRALEMPDDVQVSCMDFHANGKWLVSGDLNGVMRVFDVESGELIRQVEAHDGFLGYLEFWEEQQLIISGSPGGHRVGVASDQSVKLWTWREPDFQLQSPTVHTLPGFLSAVAIDLPNQRLFLGDSLGWLTAITPGRTSTIGPSAEPPPQSSRVVWRVQLPNRIHAIALNDDGKTIACGFGFNPDHETKRATGIWLLPWQGSADQRVEPRVGESTVCGLSFLPGGELLATNNWAGVVSIFDRDANLLWSYACDTGGAIDLNWSEQMGCLMVRRRLGNPCLVYLPPGLVAGSASKPVVPLLGPEDADYQRVQLADKPPTSPFMLDLLNGETDFGPVICWSSHERLGLHLAAGEDARAILFDEDQDRTFSVDFASTPLGSALPQWLHVVHSVAFHPRLPEFTLAVGPSLAQRWRVTEQGAELVLEQRMADCMCETDNISYTADGERLVMVNRSKRSVNLVNLDLHILDTFQSSDGTTTTSLRVWPDGLIVVGTREGRIFCYREDGQRLTTECIFDGHRARIDGFARSDDGNFVISRSVDDVVYRWPYCPEFAYQDFIYFPSPSTRQAFSALLGAAGLKMGEMEMPGLISEYPPTDSIQDE